MRLSSLLKLSIAAVTIASTNGASSSKSDSTSLNQLQQQLSPSPGDILSSLDLYDKFWIQVSRTTVKTTNEGGESHSYHRGSCVWSECGIDETDDAYMGDYRDGDEQWYQYRTQSFCANAAYSLYGRKKGEESVWSGGLGTCSRRHFINSFFTYGGADNLLKAIGETPVTYYSYGDGGNDDGGGNDDANNGDDAADDANNGDDAAADDANNGDDDGYSATSNAYCVEIEYEEQEEEQEQDDNNDEDENEDNDRNRQRQLSSGGSNDEDNSYSSTLGCSSQGDYIMGVFKSSSCDGNYFVEAMDTFDEYNKQHANVGCHKIWDVKNSNSYYSNEDQDDAVVSAALTSEAIYQLLSNSWTCDVRLYPNSCPDPFKVKGRYEYALRTAAHGGNPMRAYKTMQYKRPLRTLSWVLFASTLCILVLTYVVKNYKRSKSKGKDGGVKGLLQCLLEDIVAGWIVVRAASILLYEKVRAEAISRIGGGKSKRNSNRNKRSASSSKRSSKARGDKFEKVGEVSNADGNDKQAKTKNNDDGASLEGEVGEESGVMA